MSTSNLLAVILLAIYNHISLNHVACSDTLVIQLVTYML